MIKIIPITVEVLFNMLNKKMKIVFLNFIRIFNFSSEYKKYFHFSDNYYIKILKIPWGENYWFL